MNDRGRVPFALIGVFLLVSSAFYAGTIGHPTAPNPRVEESIQELTVETRSTVKEAARSAASNAARNPVTVPAATGAGSVLNESGTFRDALRLRIYTRVRERLDSLAERENGLSTAAHLPVPSTRQELLAAKRRVSIERAGRNRTALRVTVENVTLTVRRHGRIVGQKTVAPTVVVRVPVLAVHDRVRRFERRLNAGALDPGLSRRLTATLYPVSWMRGYAQYGGVPIENVVANRHVSLLTNGILLDMQRAHFGTSDQIGRRALRRETVKVGIQDLLGGSGSPPLRSLQRARKVAGDPALSDIDRLGERARAAGTRFERNMTIGVNETADTAFLETVEDINETIRDTYTVDVRKRVDAVRTDRRWLSRPADPADGWRLVNASTWTELRISGSGSHRPILSGEWHPFARYERRVVREWTRRRTWTNGSDYYTTVARRIDEYEVTVTVAGRHTNGPAPVAPIEVVHEPGGPLEGPNLADVAARAHRKLVEGRGGPDAIARRAVRGTARTGTWQITGDYPDRLHRWVYGDLATLRERVADLSITTTQGEVATYGVNPAARLRQRLSNRWRTLLDVRGRYGSVADRARVAVRQVYLRAVARRLGRRAKARAKREDALGKELSGDSERATRRLHRAYETRNRRRSWRRPNVTMRVDTRPSYLTRVAVGHDTVRALPAGPDAHPLAVRNINVVTVPYGDVAEALLNLVFAPKYVRLRTAAHVLRLSKSTTNVTGVDRTNRQSRLEAQVNESIRRLQFELVRRLRDFELGNRTTRRAVVREGLSRWQTPSQRAFALTNGSGVKAVHAAAVRRWPTMSDRKRDLLALALERTVQRHRESVRVKVKKPLVNGTANDVRKILREEAMAHTGKGLQHATRRAADRLEERLADRFSRFSRGTLSKLPMGMPVAPFPGMWYLTVNVWQVQVRGEYAQFVVRVPRGAPDSPGSLTYVRDGARVELDVDGDGTDELLGRASRVDFQTSTTIAIAVPPGPTGVGDVDGQMVERSPGWPRPGWK